MNSMPHKMSMLKADRIDIIVSFLMESGVRMILEDLRNALNRGRTGKNSYGKLSWNYPAIGIMFNKKGIGRLCGFKIL